MMPSFCLTGVAAAQTPPPPTITGLTSCITKEQNLKMECAFKLPTSTPAATCKFTKDDKVMGSTNAAVVPDPTYKNRANVTMKGQVCELYLNGLEDKAQDIKCVIKQNVEVSKVATVDKKMTATCSGLSVLLQKGTGLFLILFTLPLLSELL
ncbi:hypothetical protein ACEWY4_009676 [Coilia grayii]|uniref:Uncharacterized protein n=1 Tax=Coilia grayii TaxID=363190 RepID=A0ABD1K752_9TELE